MSDIDIRSLDVSMLRTFDALLAERSVSKAASRLFLGQPAVSASLKRLREVFGDPLFVRSAHGMEPTAQALALEPHVQAVLSELTRLLAATKEFDLAKSMRSFTVLGSDAMSLRVLPDLCGELARSGSGIRIRWDAATYLAQAQLQRSDADLGLLPMLSAPDVLESSRLYEDSYVAVSARGQFREGLTLSDFSGMPHVFFGYGRSAAEDAIERYLDKLGIHRQAQLAVGNFAQMVALVQRGSHLAIFPKRVAEEHSAIVDVHALPFSIPGYGLYLCHSSRGNSDPGLQWLKMEIERIVRSKL